jgi:hypothetical protein
MKRCERSFIEAPLHRLDSDLQRIAMMNYYLSSTSGCGDADDSTFFLLGDAINT